MSVTLYRPPYPCTEPGCERLVNAVDPAAPIVCAHCAFWQFVATPSTPLTGRIWVAHGDSNLYYLDVRPNALAVGGMLQIRFYDDTKAIYTTRLRCLGVDDAKVARLNHPRAILISPA